MRNSLQCYLPRRAFEALDVAAIRDCAREMGVSPVRFEHSTHHVPRVTTRLTCSIHMAVVFVECFARLAESGQGNEITIPSAQAVSALFKAIDDARTPLLV